MEKAAIKKILQIGIVVKDIEKSLLIYRDLLNLKLEKIEEIEREGKQLRVAFFPVGESDIELVEVSKEEGDPKSFIEERGEGVHHIAFEVVDLKKIVTNLKEKGVKFFLDITPGSRGSKIALFYPDETSGILVELVQR